jgi:NTE family protein
MLQALFERGIAPDALVGTSVGAINAAYVAVHGASLDTADALAKIWVDLRRADLFPVGLIGGVQALLGGRDSFASPHGLRALVHRALGSRQLQDTRLALHVIATDLLSGVEVRLSDGDLVESVMASASIPGVFPPVRVGGRTLVDGAVSNNTPISHALALVEGPVYVLPTGNACALRRPPRGAIPLTLHSTSLLVTRRLILEIERLAYEPRLVVLPPPCPQSIPPSDFSRAAELIRRGREDVHDYLSELDAGRVAAPVRMRMHSHRGAAG